MFHISNVLLFCISTQQKNEWINQTYALYSHLMVNRIVCSSDVIHAKNKYCLHNAHPLGKRTKKKNYIKPSRWCYKNETFYKYENLLFDIGILCTTWHLSLSWVNLQNYHVCVYERERARVQNAFVERIQMYKYRENPHTASNVYCIAMFAQFMEYVVWKMMATIVVVMVVSLNDNRHSINNVSENPQFARPGSAFLFLYILC